MVTKRRRRTRLDLLIKRKRPGVTIPVLAAEIGVTGQTLRNWINGVSSPDVEDLDQLCKALSVNRDDIAFGKGKE